jgi:hypothetical protein
MSYVKTTKSIRSWVHEPKSKGATRTKSTAPRRTADTNPYVGIKGWQFGLRELDCVPSPTIPIWPTRHRGANRPITYDYAANSYVCLLPALRAGFRIKSDHGIAGEERTLQRLNLFA